MSLICFVMINIESNLTLNFNGSVLRGATHRWKEEDRNSLGGRAGLPKAQQAQHPVWPPLATMNVHFGTWQRENHSGVTVAGDGLL